MRDLPWKDRFDLAVCWGNSFGYLDDAGDREVLQSISRAIKPGGRLMLETGSIAETLWPQFQAQKSYQFGDIHFHAVRRYDFRQSRLHIEYQFRRGEENVAHPASQRVYTVRELCELLEAAELRIDSLWGGIDGSPLALGSPQLIVLAVRVDKRQTGSIDRQSSVKSHTTGPSPCATRFGGRIRTDRFCRRSIGRRAAHWRRARICATSSRIG